MNLPFVSPLRVNTREGITDIYIIIMLLIFPLFTGFSGYSNITFSKYLFFVIATAAWLATLVLQSLLSREPFPVPRFPQGAVIVLMLICVISSLFSPWQADTLIGRGRYDGLVTLLLYGCIFLGVSSFSRPKAIHALAFAISMSLCCVVSIFQILDINLFGLYPGKLSYYDAGIQYSGTFLGTIGNTNILASLLCLSAPLFFALFVCGAPHSFWGLLPMALSAFIMAVSRCDGGIFALLLCALIGAPVLLSDLFRIRRAAAALALLFASLALAYAFHGEVIDGVFSCTLECSGFTILFIVLSFSFSLASFIIRPGSFKPSGSSLRRFFAALSALAAVAAIVFAYFYKGQSGPIYELSQLLHGNWDDSYGSSRLLIWRSCAELVPQRLLLGGGPGTLPLRLDVDFSRYVAETGATLRSHVDNAHNEYLSYLVNIGLPGLITYIAVLVSGFISWVKNSRNCAYAAIGLALCACCIHAFFGLGLCLSAPVFWIFLAFICGSGNDTLIPNPGG